METVLFSVLLYASEIWKTTAREKQMIDVFRQKCLGRMLGITWGDRVTNDEIRQDKCKASVTNHKQMKNYMAWTFTSYWTKKDSLK